MNKTELVNAIAEKANLSKVDAKNALDAALNAVAEALAANDKVALIGFGTFSVSEKGERTGLNPRTKEKIVIPARKAVKFKAGAELNAKLGVRPKHHIQQRRAHERRAFAVYNQNPNLKPTWATPWAPKPSSPNRATLFDNATCAPSGTI